MVPALRTGTIPVRLHPDGELDTQEIQLQQRLLHGFRERQSRLFSCFCQRGTGFFQIGAGCGEVFGESGAALLVGFQEADPVPALFKGLLNLPDRSAVFIHAPAYNVKPVFYLRKPGGVKGESFNIIPEAPVKIRQEAVDVGQLSCQAVEAFVDPGD